MKSDDPIVSFFQNLRLPLRAGGKDVHAFLEEHFLLFDKELRKLENAHPQDSIFDRRVFDTLKAEHSIILEFCDSILKSLYFYRVGFVGDAYSVLYEGLDKFQTKLLSCDMRGFGLLNCYCRIRPDKGDSRKDLFHIPFSQINKVRANRYSIAGYPCLYLSGSEGNVDAALSLAWSECNMPNTFYWSEFQVRTEEKPITLLDFTPAPFFSAEKRAKLYTSALNGIESKDFIIKMISTYPLMAACSLVVEGKEQNFNPEYIIPQILLSWIRKDDRYRGIAYYSCTRYDVARNYNAFNVVIPPVETNHQDHCPFLTKELFVSYPQKINVGDLLDGIQEHYDNIKIFRNKLSDEFRYYATNTLIEMRSLCDSWLGIFSSIKSGDSGELQLKFQMVETLCLTSQTMITDEYADMTYQQLKTDLMDSDDILARCTEILKEFQGIQSSIQSLRNLNLKYFPIPQYPDFRSIDDPDLCTEKP